MIRGMGKSAWLLGMLSFLTGCGGASVAVNATSGGQDTAAPAITVQPANQSAVSGQTATFSVTATGAAPLTYAWMKNGTAIEGGTASIYTTPPTAAADDNAMFSVKVTNAYGSIMSGSAKLTVLTSAPTPGQATDVVTYKNDLARTGLNATESVLSPSAVSASSFGLLRNIPVDGKVDAQPLYLAGLAVAGGTHNVVFVATEHGSVYALDADTGSTLWRVSVLGGETPSHSACGQITPEIGITATPVIDRSAGAHGTIYLVAMSRDASANDHQRLHALDVTTGAELLGGPTEISAMVSGSGGASTFMPGQYAERAALLLSRGVLYTGFTSHCDGGPYSGWVIAFSPSTLHVSSVLNVAPNSGSGPSIWMAGGGLAADSGGFVYFLTANGAFETTLDGNGFPNKGDFGQSFIKMANNSGSLSVADYFAMSNAVDESNADEDLGSGGVLLLPDLTDSVSAVHHLAVGAGKDGNIYVVNRDSMGKFDAGRNNIYQQLSHALQGGVFSTPAYFNQTVYYGDVGGSLKAFPISNAKLASAPSSQSALQFPFPGTAAAVSANGTSGGIVWAHENAAPAVLHAYDASDLSHEIYNSNQAAGGRDHFGAGNKFITPTIADGKVFVGTQNSVAIFGLLH